jgi:hypothetical protein
LHRSSNCSALYSERAQGLSYEAAGKESNRLEDVENGSVQSWNEVQEIYMDARRDPVTLSVIPILKTDQMR